MLEDGTKCKADREKTQNCGPAHGDSTRQPNLVPTGKQILLQDRPDHKLRPTPQRPRSKQTKCKDLRWRCNNQASAQMHGTEKTVYWFEFFSHHSPEVSKLKHNIILGTTNIKNNSNVMSRAIFPSSVPLAAHACNPVTEANPEWFGLAQKSGCLFVNKWCACGCTNSFLGSEASSQVSET